MNWYSNVAIKTDISLCELTLGLYIYKNEKSDCNNGNFLFVCVCVCVCVCVYLMFLNSIEVNVLWILVYILRFDLN